jgi:hypothetical protein
MAPRSSITKVPAVVIVNHHTFGGRLSLHTPRAWRLHDGSVGMWYAGIPIGDEELGYRICLARFPVPWFT